MVPQTRGNGALDLFNNQQARFFNRMLLVELGAQRPVRQQADVTRQQWATTHSWAAPSPSPGYSSTRPRSIPAGTMRDQWMSVPRGTPEAPSAIGATFPQMPSRGEAATARGGSVFRHGRGSPGGRPGTADSQDSTRIIIEDRETYRRKPAFPRSLREKLERARAEEDEERQKLQAELHESSRFNRERLYMQKKMGATQVYIPEDTMQSRTPGAQGSSQQMAMNGGSQPTAVKQQTMPFAPLRNHRASAQRGWIV